MLDSENIVGRLLNDRYDVLNKIGTGGMATVYKAHDNVLDRNVAIKVLRDNLEDQKEIVSNFIKEARSSASLVHPNIVSVYDVCEFEGINYMVMELVDGATLKQYIKSKQRLPWQEACDYAIQIGQGIQAAHEKNIIHRDIKPQNIIMAPGGVLKVTDFGIAKAMESDKTIAGGTALGSVHYISPEQARGGFTDGRADIYSLGVVLYEMLAGRVPFDGDSPVSVALMHIEKDPVNVKCVNMDVPSDLAYVTMKAMSRDVNKRYQIMQEFLDDLRAVLADEPLPSKEKDRQETVEEHDDFIIEKPEEDEITKADPRRSQKQSSRKNNKEKSEKKKKAEKRKKANRNAAIMALSTILVFVLVIVGIFVFKFNPFAKHVPDLSYRSIEDAIATAQASGYKVSNAYEFTLSDTVADGNVAGQIPAAGVAASKSEPITLIISVGTSGGGIEVPNVSLLPVDDAAEQLENETLEYKIVSEFSSDVEYGAVIRQTPFAGTHVNSGDIVTIHVSIGPGQNVETGETAEIPSVLGLYRDNAESELSMRNLGLGTVTKKASDEPEGTIIMQSPGAGSVVNAGDTVSVVISSGSLATTLSSSYVPPERTDEDDIDNDVLTPPDPDNADESENTDEESSTDMTRRDMPGNTDSAEQSDNAEESSNDGTSSEESGSSTQLYTVKIPDAAGDVVSVEIYANGELVHSGEHRKTEGSVAVQISGSGTVNVEAYIDGSKVSEKKITF